MRNPEKGRNTLKGSPAFVLSTGENRLAGGAEGLPECSSNPWSVGSIKNHPGSGTVTNIQEGFRRFSGLVQHA